MAIFTQLGTAEWAFVLAAAYLAGFVKGAIGFALPLILISTISLVLDPRLALAALIIPTVASNLLQVGRAGRNETATAFRGFWPFVVAVCLAVFISAQAVVLVSDRAMYLVIGLPVTVMSLLMLSGARFDLPARSRPMADVIAGTVAGLIGGISGVWGPPTVLFLLSLGVTRSRQMAVQGIVYALGSITLMVAHLRSGLLNEATLPLSLALLVPVGLGMLSGFAVGERLNPNLFRRATLAVLVLAGANLIRRGLF